MRRSLIWAVLATAAWGQAPAPAFEVVVIKPFAMDARSIPLVGFTIDKARVHIVGYPLQAVIAKAYNIKSYQLVGPDWVTAISSTSLFEIDAKG